jgi:hypothetical protein
MPITQTIVVNITCDNPACPGNTLDPADRLGWTFVTAELYGSSTAQYVYCTPVCAGAIQGGLELLPPVELPPPEPG